MEPTIYKPSIYKGAGIYKTGAEGGDSFFTSGNYGIRGTIGLDYNNKIIKSSFDSSTGPGGFCLFDNLDGFNNLSLCIKFTKNNVNSSNKTILGYISDNSAFNTGRIIRLSEYLNQNYFLLQIASSTTTWNDITLTGYGPGTHKVNIDIEKNGTNYKIVLKIDDVEKYNAETPIYSNGRFSPVFFMSNFYIPSYSNDYSLYTNDSIDMSESYLIVDNKKYFGYF